MGISPGDSNLNPLRSLARPSTFWLGIVAVIAPLALLLGLQYRWLNRLEEAGEIVRQATLSNFLEAACTEHEYFYRTRAEQLLNIPEDLFVAGRLGKAAGIWKAQGLEGVKRLFLVDFTRSEFGNFLVYEPSTQSLVTPPSSDETLAIILACAPWQLRGARRGGGAQRVLRVDEEDPAHRIVLRAVTDDSLRVLGIAGFIADEAFLRERLLPKVVEKAFYSFFPEDSELHYSLVVTDGEGGAVLGDPDVIAAAEQARSLPFLFTDWALHLQHLGEAEKALTRSSFALNLLLSVLLALVLIGALALALRAARRAMLLSQLKSDFVSNVSHELRTPLASIRVYAEFLRSGRVRDESQVAQYGGTIEAESRRLSRLIENMLDLSRIESGRKSYRLGPTDLALVVEEIVNAFRLRPGVKDFLVEYAAPADPLPEIAADGEALGRALGNLLDNALKYSGEGRYIGVTLRRDGDEAVLAVTDRGIGIPRDEQSQIFDRFHRVGRGLVHEVKGSGLGLALVSHAAEAHGGRVTVDSEPGKGSIFSLRLPLPTTPDTAPQANREGES